ncbi:MAG: acyclic terpene utilization AtuA family protein [Acidimicrobiales bacterium]
MSVRIGSGQGFYGDGIDPVSAVLATGVDYLVCEALAELTLAILQKDRQRDESLGYTRDLPAYLKAVMPDLVSGRTRFITNAGGINPLGAGRLALDVARSEGARGLKVATVIGDDVRPLGAQLDLDSRDHVLFANAYLGAAPIARALDQGADVVITGRVADASLYLAPLLHEFGWDMSDWDLLAAGVTIGHLLECSGQVTGGNYSGRWWEKIDPATVGFPIAEVSSDGTAVITKPPGTSGAVSFDTVREQLLYEVHDPARYLNPDVVADFTAVDLEDLGQDRVRVSGARGAPAPETYKALVCTPAGWAGESRFCYAWPDAEAKVRAAIEFVRRRTEADGLVVEEWCEEYFGVDGYGGSTVGRPRAGSTVGRPRAGLTVGRSWAGSTPGPGGTGEPPEVIGRLAWRCADVASAGAVGRGLGILGLSGPPGISGLGRARGSKPTQLMALQSLAVDKGLVDAQVGVFIEEA